MAKLPEIPLKNEPAKASDAKKSKPSGFAMGKLMGPSKREKTRSDIREDRK